MHKEHIDDPKNVDRKSKKGVSEHDIHQLVEKMHPDTWHDMVGWGEPVGREFF